MVKLFQTNGGTSFIQIPDKENSRLLIKFLIMPDIPERLEELERAEKAGKKFAAEILQVPELQQVIPDIRNQIKSLKYSGEPEH